MHNTDPYRIADRVQFVGPVKAGYPLPGTVGTVVAITDHGAIIGFRTEQIVVPPHDRQFQKVSF